MCGWGRDKSSPDEPEGSLKVRLRSWFAPRSLTLTFLFRKNTEFVRDLKSPFGQSVRRVQGTLPQAGACGRRSPLVSWNLSCRLKRQKWNDACSAVLQARQSREEKHLLPLSVAGRPQRGGRLFRLAGGVDEREVQWLGHRLWQEERHLCQLFFCHRDRVL